MLPTRYSCVNSLPLASWIDTHCASNRRAVVSAMNGSGRPASPAALATARKISAVACCCRLAVCSRCLRRVASAAEDDSRFWVLDLAGLALFDPDFAVLDVCDFRARDRPPRRVVLLAPCSWPFNSSCPRGQNSRYESCANAAVPAFVVKVSGLVRFGLLARGRARPDERGITCAACGSPARPRTH